MRLYVKPSPFLIVLIILISPGVANAHVLRQDHGIAGVLHIPPDDNPKAGQPTRLEVSFGDQKDAFSLSDCNCHIIVKHASHIIQQVGLVPAVNGATLDSTASVNFPATGNYEVVVKGSAKDGAFNDFQLTYPVRVLSSVKRAAASTAQGQQILLIGAGSLLVLAMVGYLAVQDGKRYQRTR